MLQYGIPTIENTPSKYQDLQFKQLIGFCASRGLGLNQEKYKENLGSYTENGQYNLPAQLLSDNSHFPVRVSVFSGKSKADNMYSVREFGYRCLLISPDNVLRYGDVLNIIQSDEANRIVERKEVPLFENIAFREAIINAFLHNRWVDGNEPIFTVYTDRIEILSRGSLPPKQTLEGFFAGESIPVNEKLSEIFLQLHLSEKTGRGVPKIIEVYGKEAFTFRKNSIVVTILFQRIHNPQTTTGNKLGNNMGDKKALNPRRTPIIRQTQSVCLQDDQFFELYFKFAMPRTSLPRRGILQISGASYFYVRFSGILYPSYAQRYGWACKVSTNSLF